MGKLTARQVDTLKEQGRYSDGGNLYLNIALGGSKSWVFFFRFGKGRREMGLGSVAATALAQARVKALAALKLVREGTDPIKARDDARQQSETARLTFGGFADDYLASHRVTEIKNKADRRM